MFGKQKLKKINIKHSKGLKTTGKGIDDIKNRISPADLYCDICAGAMLTTCRKEAHDYMYSRIKSKDKVAKKHYKMMVCVNNFMKKNGLDREWISLRTPKDEVYYLNLRRNRTQWERPKVVEDAIDKGKRNQLYPINMKWKECEFLFIKLVQCEQSAAINKESNAKCMYELRKLSRCFKKRDGEFKNNTDDGDI